MKKVVIAVSLVFLFSQIVLAGNFFENILRNKPQAYFGWVYSYSHFSTGSLIAHFLNI